MARSTFTGIDIGSSTIRVVVAQFGEKSALPTIVGTGSAPTNGLRHGYVVDSAEARASVRQALDEAEKSSGTRIKRAFLAIGGVSVESHVATGSAFISRADNEVTERDIIKAHDAAEAHINQSVANIQIIQDIPLKFTLDNEEVLGGDPAGMKGSRLEVKMLFITCLSQHLRDFAQAVEDAGVTVDDVLPSPVAASFATLSNRQKIAGCVLANIGAETLSIAVFENGVPISLKIFPIGGMEITNDIALGLKIPLEEAEEIKRGARVHSYPKKKLEDIISARLSDIFDLLGAHLKKIGKDGLLPAGIILTGGGSEISNIEEVAKSSLHIPSKIAAPDFAKTTKNQIKDSNWAVAYGLCIMGLDNSGSGSGIARKFAKKTSINMGEWVRQFLP